MLTIAELIDRNKFGYFPTVLFTSSIDHFNTCIDSGMKGVLLSVRTYAKKDNRITYQFRFNLEMHLEHNKMMMSNDYYDSPGYWNNIEYIYIYQGVKEVIDLEEYFTIIDDTPAQTNPSLTDILDRLESVELKLLDISKSIDRIMHW